MAEIFIATKKVKQSMTAVISTVESTMITPKEQLIEFINSMFDDNLNAQCNNIVLPKQINPLKITQAS